MKELIIILFLCSVSFAGSGIDRLNEETDLPFWRLNILSGDPNELEEYFRVLIESLQDVTDDIITDLNQLTSVESDITATAEGEQGDKTLTAQVNEVSVVTNLDGSVTLPVAAAGRTVNIINNGDNTLTIWPTEGDNAGAGTDLPLTLASGNNIQLVAYDSTNWEKVITVDALFAGFFTSGSVIYADTDGTLTETNPGFTWLNNILGITGDVNLSGSLIVSTPHTPSSITDTGTTGTIAWDSSFIYVCVTTNLWKRVAISFWDVENVIFGGENVTFNGEQVVFK